MLAAIDPAQRAVVVLHYYLDLTLPETAAALGIPVGTAKSRLNRALGAMRIRVADDERVPASARPRSDSHEPSEPTPRSLSVDQLRAALGDVGGPVRPDYLTDIVAQAGRMRQRPGWTFLERWLPMDIAARRQGVPRAAVLFAAVSCSCALRRGRLRRLTTESVGTISSARDLRAGRGSDRLRRLGCRPGSCRPERDVPPDPASHGP